MSTRNQPGFPVSFDQNPHSEPEPPVKRLRSSEKNSPISEPSAQPVNPKINPAFLPGSKGICHMFYKTRMCHKFLEGNCMNGENCTFAHGFEDMREPPPNWEELIREKDGGAWSRKDDLRLIQKLRLCKKFYFGGVCPYGENCTFLHQRPLRDCSSLDEWPKSWTDIPMQREITRGSAIANASGFDQPEMRKIANPNSDGLRAKQVPWKTKLCRKWEITGHCPFGERCRFSHGQSDLTVSRAQVDVHSGRIRTRAVAGPVGGVRQDKDFSRWSLKRKINEIYADWIDGLTPPHAFSR